MDTALISTKEDSPANKVRERRSPWKLALVCDSFEERWPSMDLIGDMLYRCLKDNHAGDVEVEQLRAPWRSSFSALPGCSGSRLCWNADRLINRFRHYPRWLRGRADQFDLFHIVDHSYAQLALELPPERTVISCHDVDTFRCLVTPLAEPRPAWFRTMTRRVLNGLRSAAHVVCLSEATKAQLLHHGWFSEDRLTVVYPGVDPIFSPGPVTVSEEDALRLVEGNHQPYLLHVGSTIGRKRIDVLLRVFAAILEEFPDVRLVRVGGPFSAEQSQLANDLGVREKIVIAPHIPAATLAALYRRATMVLQPSDAEGFGLPVIEAMSCGCPVVASDIAALREAGGAAAAYCPAGDIETWTKTVAALLRERATSPERWQARQAVSRQHASRFTWSSAAKQTVAVYRRVWNEAAKAPLANPRAAAQ